MKKFVKFSVFFSLIFSILFLFSACDKKNEVPSESNKTATINDVNYSSLTEAVENAKSGDTIRLYNDIKDNKNVVITKPITIKGVLTSSQIKPKFYGSITIDLTGEDDSITIEDIEIIHSGTNSDGNNNDTTTGITLLDGGLNLNSNVIGLDENATPDENATGVIISRRFGSKNYKPIIIKGNRFNSYQSNNQGLSSAMIIKKNKKNELQNLTLNEDEIFNNNVFNTGNEANQFISIDYSSTPIKYSFFATSSFDELINALNENQNSSGCSILFFPSMPLKEQIDNPLEILEKTSLSINGNNEANFNNSEILLHGNMNINTNISNAIINRQSPLSSLIFKENVKQNNVQIK